MRGACKVEFRPKKRDELTNNNKSGAEKNLPAARREEI